MIIESVYGIASVDTSCISGASTNRVPGSKNWCLTICYKNAASVDTFEVDSEGYATDVVMIIDSMIEGRT